MSPVFFEGQKYNWDGHYYSPVGGCANGRKRLHVAVWEHHNGPVPDGCEIHHINRDRADNRIENLRCLPGRVHKAKHARLLTEGQKARRATNLHNIRPLACAWHGSPEGRQWHSEHAKRLFRDRTPQARVCEHCGQSYQTKRMGRTRFCSNKCRSAARRKAGKDLVERICCICRAPFQTNKYHRNKTCSHSCGAKMRWQERRLRSDSGERPPILCERNSCEQL